MSSEKRLLPPAPAPLEVSFFVEFERQARKTQRNATLDP
jgi:hypothetical protein